MRGAMPAGVSRPTLARPIYVLAAVAFCVALGFGILAPAIPLFARSFGVGPTGAGAVVSAFALMRFVFGLAGGRLVDRVGERTALVGGIAVVAVSSLLAGLARSYPQLLALRGVGGVGSAVFTIAAVGLVLRTSSAEQRGQAMSVYGSGFIVGGIVGPAFGGLVLGWSLRAPFFLYTGTLVLAGLAGALMLPKPGRKPAALPRGDERGESGERGEGTEHAEPSEVPRTSVPEALASPAYRAALVSNFAVGFALFGVRATLVPLLVVDSLRLAPGWVGAAMLVSTLVQALLMLPAGRAVDGLGRRPTLLAGGLAGAAALAGLALARGPVSLLVAMGALGVGSALLGVVPGALVGDVVHGRGGTAVAVFQMSSDLGAILGPLVAGLLVSHASYAVALVFSAAVLGLAGLLGLTVPAARPAAAEPPPAGSSRPSAPPRRARSGRPR